MILLCECSCIAWLNDSPVSSVSYTIRPDAICCNPPPKRGQEQMRFSSPFRYNMKLVATVYLCGSHRQFIFSVLFCSVDLLFATTIIDDCGLHGRQTPRFDSKQQCAQMGSVAPDRSSGVMCCVLLSPQDTHMNCCSILVTS